MDILFSVGKCKTKAAFSAKLKQPRKLDLAAIKQKFEVLLDTPILLVVKIDKKEIIVHGYGELMFKEGGDTEWMEGVAQRLYEVGLGSKG